MTYSLTHGYLEVCCLICKYLTIFQIFLLLISGIINFAKWTHTLCVLHLSRFVLWPRIWYFLWTFCVLLKRMCIQLFGSRVFCKCQLGYVGSLCCSGFLHSYWISGYFLNWLLWRGMLNSPTIIVDLSVNLFISVSFDLYFLLVFGLF